MPVRPDDDETARLVLARGLMPLEQLVRFRAPSAGSPGTLFERLVSAGVITPQLQAELESGSAEPAAAPQRPPTSSVIMRRSAHKHAFEEGTAGPQPPSSTAGAPAAPATPSLRRPASSQAMRAITSSPALPAQPRASGIAGVAGRGTAGISGEAEAVPAMPPGWPGGLAPTDSSPGHVQQYLMRARQAGASDLFINSGLVPTVMVDGELHAVEGVPALTSAQAGTLARQIMTREQWEHFERLGGLCFCYAVAGGSRYRATAFKHRGGCDVAVRIIAEQVPPLEQLGLPESSAKLAQFPDGLVLICSPAGSGKTTTMMALLDQINRAQHVHIVTFEEPIEYLLQPVNSRITQREVGSHTASYRAAYQAALREDADVVAFGELRHEDVTRVALQAAAAGQLVFATVQAADCARAVDRILESSTEPQQTRSMVADNLRAVCCQQLVHCTAGQGRAVACELLFNSISVGNIIRDGKTHNLVNVMQTGRQQGMLMMDESLKTLLDQKVISAEEAYARARNKGPFKNLLAKETKPEAPKEAEPAKAPAAKR